MSATGKKGSGSGKVPPKKKSAASSRMLGTRLKTAEGRTISSQRWLERQLNDPYVAAAKAQGWRSRAAFKLIQINERYKLLKPGMRVVDLGAVPGGWSQVAAKEVKAGEPRGGMVVAVDINAMEPIAHVKFLQQDFNAEEAEDRIIALLGGKVDVVLSDMAEPAMGHKMTDHLRIMAMAEGAGHFAATILAPGGMFLCKVLQGGSEHDLLMLLKRNFRVVRHVKPEASRADSAELYVLATGFRGGEGAS
jgi:23S rRNA (uridine2552-2'-O)-methyltransferase